MISKPVLRLFYTDFWDVWNPEDNYFTNVLRKAYDVTITDDKPDILIYSWEGKNFLKFDCIRIYYTPENWLRPQYKDCDFSMSFEYWNDARNLRLPNYVLYNIHPDQLDKRKFDADKIIADKTGFCSMVISNPNTKERNDFFYNLSKYKFVASGGKHLNNIGGRVDNKYAFIQSYKFNLCFENARHPGYTTEKLPEAMSCNTIPLYWGNPLINLEFNTKSFFNIKDYNSDNDMIEDIIEHDKDDTKYYVKFMQPWFEDNIPNQYFDEKRTLKFLTDIIDRKGTFVPIAKNKFKKYIYYPIGHQIDNATDFINNIFK